jgi:phage terminase small subunit
MPGPKQLPAAIQKAKGTYKPERYEMDTSKQPMKFVYKQIPMPPEEMPDKAKDLWMKQLGYARELYGYIGFIDLELLEQYCMTNFYLKACHAEIQSLDEPFHNDNKNLWVQYHKLSKEFQQLSGRFGFDPSSRGGIKLSQQNEEKKEPDFEL